MPDQGDINATLSYWKEHREQLRQSEGQRAVMTIYILVIAAGISGFVVQQHFAVRTIPLSLLTSLIGIYGALAAAKYHERADYHLSQARALTAVLVDSGGLADHKAILDTYREGHYNKYPRLSKIRLYWLWEGLNLGIALYGFILLIISLAVL
jgi:hypothetical protein